MDSKRALTMLLVVLSTAVAGVVAVQMRESHKAVTSASAVPPPAAFRRVVDIGHPLGPDNPAWPGDAHPFQAVPNATFEKDGYFTRKFTSLEHFGTHLDAPAHFVKGGWTVDQIPVSRLYGPAVVIDARAESARDPDYRLAPDKINEWESRNGRIPRGSIVVMYTGWSARWNDAKSYRNMDSKGVMHFPGYGVDAVKLLIDRGVVGLTIDTLSVDYGASKDFPVHHLSHGASLFHVENLADVGSLPETSAYLLVAPIDLEGGSGGPARVFALLP